MFKKISGTKDILPDELIQWRSIEEAARTVFALYNYKEIRPPLVEEAALFNRSLGQSSEIVQKQMFLIQNKDELYCLRPEATASIVRAYIENNLDKTVGFSKLYYSGPMFRLERPQKGRLRQFHHIGCEAIGSADAALDVEVIALADKLLKSFSVSGYKLKINTLGCGLDKQKLTGALRDHLKGAIGDFCEECQVRFEQNVLRILDCKNQKCRDLVAGFDFKDLYLCGECKTHFQEVIAGLDALGIPYEIAGHLVRGLDYYTRTVFEITHGDLGAQDAIGAGGRYNNLVKELGGPDVGAVGFAFGVERLLIAAAGVKTDKEKHLAYLITLGDAAKKEGVRLIYALRNSGIACDTDYESRSIKSAMRRADDLGAAVVLILGDDELNKKVVMVKDMKSGQQKEVPTDQLIKELKC